MIPIRMKVTAELLAIQEESNAYSQLTLDLRSFVLMDTTFHPSNLQALRLTISLVLPQPLEVKTLEWSV